MTSTIMRRLRGAAVWLMLLVAAVPALAQSDRPPDGSPPRTESTAPDQEPAPPAPDPSFSALFHQIGQDLRDFSQRDHLVWIGVGAGLSLAGHRADRGVTGKLSASAGVESVLDPGRVVGGAMVQLGGAAATYAIGRLTNKPDITHVGSDLMRAGVMAQAVTQGIKIAARRTRPDGTSLSFPSGHAASVFASATVIERHYGWKAGVPAYALASYVAASRLSENRHFLSDVIFGATIGIVAGRTVTIGHGGSRFALAPLVTPGGVGVALVKISR